MALRFSSVTVKIWVSVVNTDNEVELIPAKNFECEVQPSPHYHERPQAFEVEVFAAAQIKFINDLYVRMTKEQDLQDLLDGLPWGIEAYLDTFTTHEINA